MSAFKGREKTVNIICGAFGAAAAIVGGTYGYNTANEFQDSFIQIGFAIMSGYTALLASTFALEYAILPTIFKIKDKFVTKQP